MRRLPFVRHSAVSKLRYRYVSCRHPVEKPRWHALWPLARTGVPRTPAQVADVVGLSAVTARAVLHRWNARGPDGVADQRAGDGAEPTLTARRRAARPTSRGRARYEWLYVYGFARPATGQTLTVVLPRVKVERMADALAAFAAHADPPGEKVLVLVGGNAGWHTAKRLTAPADVRLHFLPPCTPQLQPVEPFGALVREAVANGTYERLADLRRVVRRRCRRLAEDRAMVLGAIGFRWAGRLEQ
jgi:hypothetical protein